MAGAWARQPNPQLAREFFRMLALCHTVIPDGGLPNAERPAARPPARSSRLARPAPVLLAPATSAPPALLGSRPRAALPAGGLRLKARRRACRPPPGPADPKLIRYEAESPDEAALVVAAKVFGFFFFKRTNTRCAPGLCLQSFRLEALGTAAVQACRPGGPRLRQAAPSLNCWPLGSPPALPSSPHSPPRLQCAPRRRTSSPPRRPPPPAPSGRSPPAPQITPPPPPPPIRACSPAAALPATRRHQPLPARIAA
jgi:hypothetical protein